MIDDRKPERVAVLNDDIRFIRMIERMLGSVNISTEPVTTPDIEEAVRVVTCTGCQAALVDIYMYGDPKGFRMIEALRRNPGTADLPLIVTTATYRTLARRLTFLAEHQCGLLVKPFGIDDLLTRLGGASAPGGDDERRPRLHVPATGMRVHGGAVGT